MSIRMYDCIISRRGKGAKGVVPVKTFGKPVTPKKGNVTKAWDYSHADKVDEAKAIEAVRKYGSIVELLYRGADSVLKSQTIKSLGETSQLAARLLAEKLAIDLAEAKSVAGRFLDAIRTTTQMAEEDDSIVVPTIDQLINGRRKQVAKLKASGLWGSKLVKPAKASEPEPEEPEEDDSDDDDTEEDIEESESDHDDDNASEEK